MQVLQHRWLTNQGWEAENSFLEGAQLVLAFGMRELIADPAPYQQLRARYPSAAIVFCSTAGEILGHQVLEKSIVATAVRLDKSRVRVVQVHLGE